MTLHIFLTIAPLATNTHSCSRHFVLKPYARADLDQIFIPQQSVRAQNAHACAPVILRTARASVTQHFQHLARNTRNHRFLANPL